MAGAAGYPYRWDITRNDDVDVEFLFTFRNKSDGSLYSFTGKTVEYSVMDRGGAVVFSDDAVSVASSVGTFTIPAGTLDPGIYGHACRIRTTADDALEPAFAGKLVIEEGYFA